MTRTPGCRWCRSWCRNGRGADPPAALALSEHPAGAPPRGRTLDWPLPAVLARALAHQDLPFTEFLLAARAAARGSALDELGFALRRPDNFDTRTLGAVLLSESADGFEFEGMHIRTLPLARDSGLRPLSVFAQESGGAVHMLWNYDASRFEAANVASLADEYAQLLHACLAEPAAGGRARTPAGG